jgi:hypothetical protein
VLREAVWVQVTTVRWLADQRGRISAPPSAIRPIEEDSASAVWDAPVALLHALGFLVTEDSAEAAAAAVAAASIACTAESAVGAATVTEVLRARNGGGATARSCCERQTAAN